MDLDTIAGKITKLLYRIRKMKEVVWLEISDDNQTDSSTLPLLKEESNDKYQIEA